MQASFVACRRVLSTAFRTIQSQGGSMKRSAAEIVGEYGPFPGVDAVHGVTYDGQRVWIATGGKLNAFDPASGEVLQSIEVAADAGTAFDGRYLFQIADKQIQKIDPQTGRVLATIPAPGGGFDSGLTWAEGSLWVGQYRDRKIHQIDPESGAILRTIESNRFVTGVTWVEGELWHGTWESEHSECMYLRTRIRRRRSVLLRWGKSRHGEEGAAAKTRCGGA
jgi:sugar lactone lactonase YvrE